MVQELAIELSDIQFAWDHEWTIDLDRFVVEKGEKLFLGGASGSGKSSILSVLAGVATPAKGSVDMLGTAVHRLSAAERDRFRADHVGYIFQMFNLVPYLSVIENVTLPLRFSEKRASKVTHPNQGATRLLEHLGMGDLVDRNVLDLSVGQQQRVATARALIGEPEIILADEPTSALDKENSDAFVDLLFEECVRSETTLVFVSHDQALASKFDRSYMLKGGQV